MYAVVRLDPLELITEYPLYPDKIVWPTGDISHAVSVGDKHHGYMFVNKSRIETPPSLFHRQSGTENFYKNGTLTEIVLYKELPLDQVKQLAKQKINEWRNRRQDSGFEFEKSEYQSGDASRSAIHGAMTHALSALHDNEPYKVVWTTADNSRVTMDANKLLQFGRTASHAFQGWHQKATELKKNVEALTSAADIQALLNTLPE